MSMGCAYKQLFVEDYKLQLQVEISISSFVAIELIKFLTFSNGNNFSTFTMYIPSVELFFIQTEYFHNLLFIIEFQLSQSLKTIYCSTIVGNKFTASVKRKGMLCFIFLNM